MRQIVDVIFKQRSVRGLQSQQILVPSFHNLQFVLGVLGLALEGGKKRKMVRLKEREKDKVLSKCYISIKARR